MYSFPSRPSACNMLQYRAFERSGNRPWFINKLVKVIYKVIIMKKVINTRGFTLIELLVVIAIIGILSSVVLASLNTARAKGADAAIKADLANIRAQAELSYDNNTSTYTNVCSDTTVIAAINAAKNASGITAATTATGTAVTSTTATCHANATGYAIAVPLKTNNAQFACIDSSGQSTTTNQLTAASGTCGS